MNKNREELILTGEWAFFPSKFPVQFVTPEPRKKDLIGGKHTKESSLVSEASLTSLHAVDSSSCLVIGLCKFESTDWILTIFLYLILHNPNGRHFGSNAVVWSVLSSLEFVHICCHPWPAGLSVVGVNLSPIQFPTGRMVDWRGAPTILLYHTNITPLIPTSITATG